ncbi:YadA-like family protein [Photobacterium minamisatsumaniensis]|uniref:YadA C-terminal domain-containing protein n=1 Tax=Photobacterium minamisatsumaniensis TaxID=2910233 RepID=UPI003D0B6BFB
MKKSLITLSLLAAMGSTTAMASSNIGTGDFNGHDVVIGEIAKNDDGSIIAADISVDGTQHRIMKQNDSWTVSNENGLGQELKVDESGNITIDGKDSGNVSDYNKPRPVLPPKADESLPMEPEASNPIEAVPTHPIEDPEFSNPIEPEPEHPIEDGKPGQGPEGEPSNPDRPNGETEDRIQGKINDRIDAVDGALDQGRTSISDNTAAINDLRTDFEDFADETNKRFNELDDRMDGVVASMHAITNARPMVSNPGDFAMGAGVGFAGSKEAIAIGGAYAINENWAASATMNYESSTRHSSSQVSGGAGVQYRF